MNIAIDLDNTIFDAEPIYKMGFVGFKYKYELPKTLNIYECYPKEIADNIMNHFRSIENYKTVLLDDKYPQLIQEWKNTNNIKYITSRKSNNGDIYFYDGIGFRLISWSQYYTYKQLLNSKIKASIDDIIMTNGHSKIKSFQRENIGLVIDDSPIVIEECLNNNIDCVMISTEKTPYNHYLRKKSQWANNLFEVSKIKSL